MNPEKYVNEQIITLINSKFRGNKCKPHFSDFCSNVGKPLTILRPCQICCSVPKHPSKTHWSLRSIVDCRGWGAAEKQVQKCNITTVWRPAVQFPQQLYFVSHSIILTPRTLHLQWKDLHHSYSLVFSLFVANGTSKQMGNESLYRRRHTGLQ